MMTDASTTQERVDLLKLAKVLVGKCAQIIVQARDGSKIHTECKPDVSGHNTFNLVIRELVHVDKEVRRVLGMAPTDRWSPLCVEIYLTTADGDLMSLETWTISLISDSCDFTCTKPYTLYSRLGILLKSLLAVTRVIPAYAYARRQSSDSYIIGHRIYRGDSESLSVGDKFKQLKVGSVGMPVGTLSISVAYRTVMLLSPQPSNIESSDYLNSDHFKPDFGSKQKQNNDESTTYFDEESCYKIGAFAENRNDSLAAMDSDLLIPEVPFGSLLKSFQQSPPLTNTEISRIESHSSSVHGQIESSESDQKNTIDTNTSAVPAKSSYNDDFILVDLVKPPFVEPTGNIELGVFYQEWQTAPPLQTCPLDPPVIEQVGDLTSQLQSYESCSKEFDNMVTSLCIDSDNSEDMP